LPNNLICVLAIVLLFSDWLSDVSYVSSLAAGYCRIAGSKAQAGEQASPIHAVFTFCRFHLSGGGFLVHLTPQADSTHFERANSDPGRIVRQSATHKAMGPHYRKDVSNDIVRHASAVWGAARDRRKDTNRWIASRFLDCLPSRQWWVCYALEAAAHWFVLAFAGTSILASTYGFLQGAWPFGLVEGVWSLMALLRWVGWMAEVLSYATAAKASMILHSATVPCWHWSTSCRSSAPSAFRSASLRFTSAR
jgi:hypothetical protein